MIARGINHKDLLQALQDAGMVSCVAGNYAITPEGNTASEKQIAAALGAKYGFGKS
jgi:ribosomal protein S19E (S16A)